MSDDGLLIPHDQLDPETLRRLIEEFVTRDGTDYGWVEAELETRVRDVHRSLERGDAAIAFDPKMGTASIITTRER